MVIQDALYNVVRPQKFSEVVGQTNTIKAIKTALTKGVLEHSLIFYGQTGGGKTTTARIVAKWLQCDSKVDNEPCCQCETCKAIKAETFADYVELNASTNGGKDDIDRLLENISFAPQYGKCKVYVIDEAHCLTDGAWKSLLKPLEEPPSHVYFILCTTDFQSIPQTIKNRCGKYEFSRITKADILGLLGDLRIKYKAAYTDEALGLLAESADGSLRNAVNNFSHISMPFEEGEEIGEDSVKKLPKRSTFAVTYAELMNFPNCTTSVFWNPISSAESQKLLDKRVIALGSELIAAEGKDPNRARRLSAKLTECEEWAKVIESGLNVFFKVAFLFVLRADSLEHLNDACADLYSIGKEKGIDIVGCYGAHAEGILAAAPLNKMMKVGKGPFKDLIVKYHIMDKTSLGDTFNHTESFFSHKNGILGGRNMFTHQPVLIDPYDKSHSGYNMCISGITGAGKSAGLKMYSSRWMEVFGYRMAFIDYDSPNGAEGEYVPLVRTEGGVVFQLKHGSDNILNIFDIDVELEYLPSIRKEVRKLNLMEKCADCTNIILSMIKDGREVDSFDTDVYLTKIVSDTVVGLYAAKGIEEGHPDSIYEDGQVYEGGRISSGRVRKAMPTLHEFFISLLNRRRFNTDELQDKAFSVALAGIQPFIKECYYSEKSVGEYSVEEYNNLPVDENGLKYTVINGDRERVYSVIGVKPYYDGQSTLRVSEETQCMDIDLSQLPPADKRIAQQIACNFVNEYFVKKNSNNPHKLQKCAVVVDEFHNTFAFFESRKFIESMYRQARKRFVCMITITQALADYNAYEETKAIVKNTAMKILYKQAKMDANFIREVTPLTESQLDQVMRLGGTVDANGDIDKSRKGECCLIDNEDTVVFIKVDYLRSEAKICETDPEKIARMMSNRRAG